MPCFALRLSTPDALSPEDAASSFNWLLDQRSTFTPGLGPSLGALGPVRTLNIDLVRIALAVYAADRTVPREGHGSNWNQRYFEVQIPVSDIEVWSDTVSSLEATINFLTGDLWRLTFTEEGTPDETTVHHDGVPQRVVLLSGGADSAMGGLVSRSLLGANEGHILLSHFGASYQAPIQRRVASQIEHLIPGSAQRHDVVHLQRLGRRLDGSSYPNEYSSRSRSLLFIALGLAAASVHSVPLWIPENGFASLNPPLGPERRGSLSTRTTHPAFLSGLRSVLGSIGAHAEIENPFTRMTKGEMFREVASLIGTTAASAFLSQTHSCSLTGQLWHGIAPGTSCGVCFGCVVRRASFEASGIPDRTNYIDASGNPALARWLQSKSVEAQVRNFIRRGVEAGDLLAMNLPTDYSIRDALDLCHRGVEELGTLYR